MERPKRRWYRIHRGDIGELPPYKTVRFKPSPQLVHYMAVKLGKQNNENDTTSGVDTEKAPANAQAQTHNDE
jgi:hypothetical protein